MLTPSGCDAFLVAKSSSSWIDGVSTSIYTVGVQAVQEGCMGIPSLLTDGGYGKPPYSSDTIPH